MGHVVCVCYRQGNHEEVDEVFFRQWMKPHIPRPWFTWRTLTILISEEQTTQQDTSIPGGFKECTDKKFLAWVTEDLMREGCWLSLRLANKT